MKIIAIVPCYKSSKIAPIVVRDLLEYVDNVICIDDNCPEKTGFEIERLISNNKLIVIAGLIVSAIDVTNSTSFSAGALIAIIANFL